MEEIEARLLRAISETPQAVESDAFAKSAGVEHGAVVGLMKSLLTSDFVTAEEVPHSRLVLTAEGREYLDKGSPEAQVFAAIPAEGATKGELKRKLGALADVGLSQAMRQRWVAVDKAPAKAPASEPAAHGNAGKKDKKKDKGENDRIIREADGIVDEVQQQLHAVVSGQALDAGVAEALRKRKLAVAEAWKTYRLGCGPKFALERRRAAADLTADMISKGTWRDKEFKQYNFDALGRPPACGALHPLLKVRAQIRKVFTNMGFQEMPSNAFVESSFWNFDALFQPQQHPARDAHDTFFLARPATTPLERIPADYVARVRSVHESGGFGSTGYGGPWREAEAEKNLLRTHTTAVSTRMLYALAARGFRPARLFSIDRVFRNEAVDRTHLAEFHQIEGLMCDEGLTLGNLVWTLQTFFKRLGLEKLRFKPAYNPYTEPSMEIFSYSEELGKWMEVGNSGMFRPEMLRPMGLPEGVNVIAWGLSLERPTMILYGIDNIRDLFGHRVSLSMVKRNPICRLGYSSGEPGGSGGEGELTPAASR
ncbi:hypothetical protein WJX81_008677 [Elliptochloris bilobata]|uniref:phenylalanine--tRNA ligase n=1 Tax=Elliptochloris bilobata TaxID=381761 RepID=A0AAW1QCS9_9CHLO